MYAVLRSRPNRQKRTLLVLLGGGPSILVRYGGMNFSRGSEKRGWFAIPRLNACISLYGFLPRLSSRARVAGRACAHFVQDARDCPGFLRKWAVWRYRCKSARGMPPRLPGVWETVRAGLTASAPQDDLAGRPMGNVFRARPVRECPALSRLDGSAYESAARRAE